MSIFNMSGQTVKNQVNISPVTDEIKRFIEGYQRKVADQEKIEGYLKGVIRRRRGRKEQYGPEARELSECRARKQAYVQALVDFESLLEVE